MKTGAYFLGLVRFGADKNRRKELFPQKPDGVDWADIFICRKNIPFPPLRFGRWKARTKKPEGEVWEKWERAYRVCVHADIQQLFAWDEIKEEFSDKGISVRP